MKQYTDDDVNAYAAAKNYAPGTLLWAPNVPLEEDAFRGGNATGPQTNFLRFSDITKERSREGRIPDEEHGDWVIKPGQGISLFIKQKIPAGMLYIGPPGGEGVPSKGEFKKQFDPRAETSWWRIEKGQTIPPGLQLVFDGVPPGHCTLTVERPMTVKAFLELVALVHFEFAGTQLYGTPK